MLSQEHRCEHSCAMLFLVAQRSRPMRAPGWRACPAMLLLPCTEDLPSGEPRITHSWRWLASSPAFQPEHTAYSYVFGLMGRNPGDDRARGHSRVHVLRRAAPGGHTHPGGRRAGPRALSGARQPAIRQGLGAGKAQPPGGQAKPIASRIAIERPRYGHLPCRARSSSATGGASRCTTAPARSASGCRSRGRASTLSAQWPEPTAW